MPRISLAQLTSAEKVREAMAEYDRGAEAFLARRGFRKALKYFLVEGDRTYDSKAIAGRAYELEHGGEVHPADFSGGEKTVAKRLEELGFRVARPEPRNEKGRPWDADEMVLAVDRYIRYRSEALDAEHPVVRDLSSLLERRAAARGVAEAARGRQPAAVARQLAGFGLLDPTHPSFGEGEPSGAHRKAWERWAAAEYARRQRVQEILDELDGAVMPASRAVTRRLAAIWETDEETSRYGPWNGSGAPEGTPSSAAPEDLLEPYAGRRAVAPRTPAAPRIEDPEPFDRANEAHEDVRGKLAAFLREHGFSVHDGTEIARTRKVDFDLAASHGDLRLIIEAKSMPVDAKAEAARLRLGLGQVLWYRHRFFAVCREPRVAVLVVERQPRDCEDWIAACRGANVVLTWPEQFEWLIEACRRAKARD